VSVCLRYGAGSVVIDLREENCCAVIQPKLPPAVGNVEAAIERCLEEPVGGEPLSKILAGRRRVVVAIPDMTRGGAVQTYLPPLLRFIGRCGVARKRVTLLTATGAHRRHTDAEREALVGREVARNWTVGDHDADDGNDEIAPLDAEMPLWVDRRALEADCLILAGVLSFHYSAGFGGGRKLIAPGLCGRATVQALHRRTLANIDRVGNWRGRTATLRPNPFNEALEETARRVGPHFALNVTVGGQREIIGLSAGDFIQSHQAACLQYAEMFSFAIRERLPLVVASCGGRPYDINLYQAHKSLDNSFRAVAPGGTIILLAECAEGWGPESFVRWLAIGSLQEHRERLEGNFEVAGHTTYALKWKATQCRVIIVSDVLARRVAGGDGPLWLISGGRSPFAIEIVRDVNEALAGLGVTSGSTYFLAPIASSSLPKIAG